MEYHGHAYVIWDNDDDLMASMRGGSISDSVKRKSIPVYGIQKIQRGIQEKDVPSNAIQINKLESINCTTVFKDQISLLCSHYLY